jgi:hypothetical protein
VGEVLWVRVRFSVSGETERLGGMVCAVTSIVTAVIAISPPAR